MNIKRIYNRPQTLFQAIETISFVCVSPNDSTKPELDGNGGNGGGIQNFVVRRIYI